MPQATDANPRMNMPSNPPADRFTLPLPPVTPGYQARLPNTYTVWDDPQYPDLPAIDQDAWHLGAEGALAAWQRQARDVPFSRHDNERDNLEHSDPRLTDLAIAAGYLNLVGVARELNRPYVREALRDLNDGVLDEDHDDELSSPMMEALAVGHLPIQVHKTNEGAYHRRDLRRLTSEERAQALIIAMLTAAGENPSAVSWCKIAESSTPWLLEVFQALGHPRSQFDACWTRKNVEENPLHAAAGSIWPGSTSTLVMFERWGWDLNGYDHSGDSPLAMAISNGNLDNTGWLMDHGAHLLSQSSPKRNGLHIAAQSGWPHMVPFLVERGMGINAIDDQGLTPLEWAAGTGNLTMVNTLMEHGAIITPEVASGMLVRAEATYKHQHLHQIYGQQSKIDHVGEGANAIVILAEKEVLRHTMPSSGPTPPLVKPRSRL